MNETMTLTSPAFADGAAIPRRHACDGDDLSPPLVWEGAPEHTRSYALIVDDPDAPAGTFVHWVAWGIAAESRGLDEGGRAPVEGRNGFGTAGYRGPCPPRGHGAHRYRFRLHALDAGIGLRAGAGADDLRRAMAGHVLASAELTGLYERSGR